jgi:hypothetical protein
MLPFDQHDDSVLILQPWLHIHRNMTVILPEGHRDGVSEATLALVRSASEDLVCREGYFTGLAAHTII